MPILIKLDPNGNIDPSFYADLNVFDSINYKGVLFLGDYTIPPYPTPVISGAPTMTPTPTPTPTPTASPP